MTPPEPWSPSPYQRGDTGLTSPCHADGWESQREASREALHNGESLGSEASMSLSLPPQSRKAPVAAGFSAQQQVPLAVLGPRSSLWGPSAGWWGSMRNCLALLLPLSGARAPEPCSRQHLLTPRSAPLRPQCHCSQNHEGSLTPLGEQSPEHRDATEPACQLGCSPLPCPGLEVTEARSISKVTASQCHLVWLCHSVNPNRTLTQAQEHRPC